MPELAVSKVILGAMVFGRVSANEQIRTIHAAIDAGINAIDTAPLYGFGESESTVGRAIVDRRDRVMVLSKCGLRWDADHGEVLFETDFNGARIRVRKDSRPTSVRRDVEASLRRLRIDAIDLMQVHHVDEKTAISDTIAELVRLKQAGLIRAIGVCNYSPNQLVAADCAAAQDQDAIAAIQCEYNLLRQETGAMLAPLASTKNIGILAYSPLAQGALSGRLQSAQTPDDWRQNTAYFSRTNSAGIVAYLNQVVAPIASAHNATQAQVALAWLLHQPGVKAVIAGARNDEQARENAQASSLRLSVEELNALGSMAAKVPFRPATPASYFSRLRRRVSALWHG